jgi:PadR family transcriptional regulator PadR
MREGTVTVFTVSGALLDACVLALVEREDAYGYILTQSMKEVFEVSESTMYPVMRRLQNDAYLTVYDVPYQGRNRRYYSITETGRQALSDYRESWGSYKGKIDSIRIGKGDEYSDGK